MITQRACVHVCRTPPHARPRSPQLKAREVANANLQPKNNNSSRGPQSAAGPPAGEPAAAEIRLKRGRPRRPPPRPPRRAPAGRSPAAPKTAPACRHGPRSLAWKQSHRRIDGGGKSIGQCKTRHQIANGMSSKKGRCRQNYVLRMASIPIRPFIASHTFTHVLPRTPL